MEIGLEYKIKNGKMYRFRQARGFSQKYCAELCGINMQDWWAVENLKFDRASSETIQKIANLIDCQPADILPEDMVGKGLRFSRGIVFKEIKSGDLIAMEKGSAMKALPHIEASPKTQLEVEDMRDAIEKTLKSLTYREREIVALKFGINREKLSLSEIAKIFKVTKERVNQVLTKAIAKLKHPVRMKSLAKFVEGYDVTKAQDI